MWKQIRNFVKLTDNEGGTHSFVIMNMVKFESKLVSGEIASVIGSLFESSCSIDETHCVILSGVHFDTKQSNCNPFLYISGLCIPGLFN